MSRIRRRPFIAAASTLALSAAGLAISTGTAHAQTCSQDYLPLPDPSCQPGAYNPDSAAPPRAPSTSFAARPGAEVAVSPGKGMR